MHISETSNLKAGHVVIVRSLVRPALEVAVRISFMGEEIHQEEDGEKFFFFAARNDYLSEVGVFQTNHILSTS